jgi:hypothetical protein
MGNENDRAKDQIIISLLRHADWENRMLMILLFLVVVLGSYVEVISAIPQIP